MTKNNFDSLDVEDTLGAALPGGAGGYALAIGQVLGQYRVIERLGRGGMAEVWH